MCSDLRGYGLESKREPAAPSPSLPCDIVVDVLSRLPVRSLVRFKTVCKQWWSLTSDPIFIREHSRRATCRPSALIFTYPGSSNLRFTKSLLFQRKYGKEVIVLPNNFSSTYISCSNTINGLICIHDQNDGFIANPLLRQFSTLPKIAPLSEIRYLGLGWDACGDVYKVIVHLVSRGASPLFRWAVLTVGTKEWRFIDDCESSYIPHYTGVTTTAQLDGDLYLIVTSKERKESIVSFAVKDEKFAMIPTPSNHYGRGMFVFSPTNSKDYLCYVGQREFEDRYFLDICLLQDDRTWMVAYSIDRKAIGFHNRLVGMVDGDLLITSREKTLKIYDRKSKTVRSFRDIPDRHWITIYNDSLVSPMMGTEEVVPT